MIPPSLSESTTGLLQIADTSGHRGDFRERNVVENDDEGGYAIRPTPVSSNASHWRPSNAYALTLCHPQFISKIIGQMQHKPSGLLALTTTPVRRPLISCSLPHVLGPFYTVLTACWPQFSGIHFHRLISTACL